MTLAEASTITVPPTPGMTEVRLQIALAKAITRNSLHNVFQELFLIAAVIAVCGCHPGSLLVQAQSQGRAVLLSQSTTSTPWRRAVQALRYNGAMTKREGRALRG